MDFSSEPFRSDRQGRITAWAAIGSGRLKTAGVDQEGGANPLNGCLVGVTVNDAVGQGKASDQAVNDGLFVSAAVTDCNGI